MVSDPTLSNIAYMFAGEQIAGAEQAGRWEGRNRITFHFPPVAGKLNGTFRSK